ncbi:MAG: DNA topoisomerase [Clostridia bacterium]|nr:DNA topoisomerase [Clostridia bacterium]
MAKAKQTAYNDQSITKLKGKDRVRLRPAVIFGSDGLEGCQHSFFEILANSVDEARAGYGSEITVIAYRDLSIRVEDNGRGVPLGYNEKEGCYNWELIYCELYAGGKYENNSEGSAYDYSLGLNGLGACATQYSSEFMQVASYKDGKVFEIDFKGGDPAGELRERPQGKGDRRSGTTVYWRPDIKVFNDIRIPQEFFVSTMRRQAIVNAGVRFVLKLEKENGEFEESVHFYANGIADYITELTGEEAMTAPVLWKMETMGRDREDKPDYKLRAEIAFCTSKTVSASEYYHNSSYLELGGSPDKAVRSAFTFAVDKYLRATGKYSKNEAKIAYQDIEDCLVIIINSASTETSYENQTKKAINNVFITKALTEYIKQQLEIYFAENPAAADLIGAQVLLNKRSRETAESNRLSLKKKLAASSMDITNRVEKFIACQSKDPEIRELYIVEGDSAAGACKQGRDATFQAIIPVRGKTLNCMKSNYARIFESKIIVDLLRVIGCGVELHEKVKTDMPPFDFNALRWSKIIICTDADEDGFQIRTLLLTLFYRLLPTLIERQKVFIAESPLFEITTKDKTYFAYNENEKAEILAKLGNTKYTLQRSKGLGENEADMMWHTTMNPATRRLIAVVPADAEETLRMFDVLMGDALQERKKFIVDNGHRYIKDADF